MELHGLLDAESRAPSRSASSTSPERAAERPAAPGAGERAAERESVASPSTDVAATTRDVRVSITRTSIGHVRLLDAAGDPAEDASRGPADAADPAAATGRGALELGDRAGDQELRALDLADGRLGALLDPAGRAEVPARGARHSPVCRSRTM